MAAATSRGNVGFKLDWRGKALETLIRRKTCDRLVRCAEIQVEDVKQAISHQCDFTNHSVPPDGPFRETGKLQDSIRYEVDRATLTARVGSDVEYALYLELGWMPPGGTAMVAPRPFQRRVFYRNLPRYGAILGARMF